VDDRSSLVANALTAHGVRSEDVVGVYGNREAALVWTLLGVLKTGGAFSILDASYPAARTLEQLEVAGIRLVVCPAGTIPSFLSEWARDTGGCAIDLSDARLEQTPSKPIVVSAH